MAYIGEGGGGSPAMAGPGALSMMLQRRRRGMGRGMRRTAPPMMPGMPIGTPVDPGFEMQPGSPLEQAGSMLRQRMLEGGPGVQPVAQDRVRWGGKIFQDPNKLWGWIQRHGGGQGGAAKFWQLHPDAARRLGMPIEGDQYEQANPMNPIELKQGLIGQLTQAQGAMEDMPAPGVHRVAANRMRAVGAAQGRAHNLARIMSRRLRGGRGGTRAQLFTG